MSWRFLFTGAVVSVRLLPNTICLDQYRKFRATYGFDDNELPVSEKVKRRVRKVMDDLNVSETIRNKIQIFSVHDIDIFHAGCTAGDFGALIGIPPNFNYENIENVSVDEVTIQNKTIPWTEETSKNFLTTLVLSESAQKFAIARQILIVQQYEFWVKQFSTMVDCVVTFSLYDLLSALLKLSNKPKLVAFPIQAATCIGGAILWLTTEELIDINADHKITQQLTELGPEYVRGGKEFYEKLCERDNIRHQLIVKSFTSKLLASSWLKKTMLSPEEQKEFFTLKLQQIEAA